MFTTNDPEALLGGPLELPGGEQPAQLPRPKRAIGKKVLLGLVALAIIGGLFWGYQKFSHRSNKQTPSASTSPETSQTKTATDDAPDTKDLKTFKSTILNLEIAYPSDWIVEEKDGLHLTSPPFSYQTTDKGEVKGNFKVYIRQTARPIDGKYIGNGVAVKPSTKLAYTNPGVGQRKETNFTNFGAATSDHFTFFMITGDFSLQKDDTLGPNYGREAGTFIVVGGWSSPQQKDDLDFSSVPLEGFEAKRAYTQAVAIIKSLHLD